LIDAPDGKYHGLVISSGYRAHPLDDDIRDRIYMLKDRKTGLLTSNTDYKYDPDLLTPAPLTESDLHNATANIAGGDAADDATRDAELASISGAEGWYIYLDDENNAGSWLGEKGLSEALIIEGVAIVTTYTPNLTYSADSCEPNIGLGKVFFLDMLDATPAFPSSIDVRGERHIKLARGGIPPTPNVVITDDGVPSICIGTECSKADLGLGVRKTYWYEVN
jgi:type IV pilus assembly protein PilY1